MYRVSIKFFFKITAEIHVRSLANFYGQYAHRHLNWKFGARQRARAVEVSNVINVPKCNKGPKCNKLCR